MDKVVEAVEAAKKEWDEAYSQAKQHIKTIEEYGKSREQQISNSLPRLNGLAQDTLALLSSLHFRLDLLAPQLPTDDQVQSARALLESWKNQSQKYLILSLSLKFEILLYVWLLRKRRKVMHFFLLLVCE
jgi:protein transport protein SEC20